MIQSVSHDSESIRLEFECFLRIGQDKAMRRRLSRDIERLLLIGLPVALFLPRIYFEVREQDGQILEMWDLEVNDPLAHRLLGFLKRFSLEETRLMQAMLMA
jgi:hypothetical protein